MRAAVFSGSARIYDVDQLICVNRIITMDTATLGMAPLVAVHLRHMDVELCATTACVCNTKKKKKKKKSRVVDMTTLIHQTQNGIAAASARPLHTMFDLDWAPLYGREIDEAPPHGGAFTTSQVKRAPTQP